MRVSRSIVACVIGKPHAAAALMLLMGGAVSPACGRHVQHAFRGRPRLTRPYVETLNDRVLAFARSQEGRQVGSGQCYDLADLALRQAGARSAPAYGAITPDSDYVWGEPVALHDVRPGDIVQFRDFNVVRTVTTNVQLDAGATGSTQREDLSFRAHHTAIVEAAGGGMLTVLEQNAPPRGLAVQASQVPVVSQVQQAPEPDGMAVTRIQVAGEIRAYRPQKL